MAKVQPFRGCYYAEVASLADVVVSPDAFQANASQHPYAYYQLDFSQDHTEVRERLNQWFAQGHLIQDDAPAFYVNLQTFFFQGELQQRLDLFLSLDILQTEVLSHEGTLSSMVTERQALLATTETHLSPLFLMYHDPQTRLQDQLQQSIAAQEALFHFKYQGITHQLYRLPEHLHQHIQTYLQHHRFYIADGHHRYAAARAYAQQHPHPESRHVLAYVTPLESAGLKVLPYHRYLSPGFVFPEWTDYLNHLQQHYDVHPLVDATPQTVTAALQHEHSTWVMQRGHRAWQVVDPHTNPTALALDTLHSHILGSLAGHAEPRIDQTKYVHFSTDMAAVQYDLLTRGGVAFFVQPTPLNALCARAEAQQMMPPKSTYFYPKVPSGILFNRFSTAV